MKTVSLGDVLMISDNPTQNIFQTLCGVRASATMTKIIRLRLLKTEQLYCGTKVLEELSAIISSLGYENLHRSYIREITRMVIRNMICCWGWLCLVITTMKMVMFHCQPVQLPLGTFIVSPAANSICVVFLSLPHLFSFDTSLFVQFLWPLIGKIAVWQKITIYASHNMIWQLVLGGGLIYPQMPKT